MEEDQNSAAFMDGWYAHQATGGSATNPYDNTTQGYSCWNWMMGFTRRADAVSHGRPLDKDY